MRTAAFLSTAVAAFAALSSAYTQPVGPNPSGNPITKPGLGEIVPVGTPYQITWNATTTGTVTLLLLRGPSSNVVPIGAPIVEQVPNTGSFSWTPSTSLEPDTLRYGIQLIVDATGAYQYTSQFGISNPNYSPNATTTAAPPANGTTTYVVPTTAANATCVYCMGNATASTGSMPSSIVVPTGSMTVPSTLVPVTPTATGGRSSASSAAASATSTGAAARKELGALVGLVGVAALLI